MTAEERNLLQEIHETGGSKEVPGDTLPGGLYASLEGKRFLRAEYHDKKREPEGGFTFTGITFYITPEGKAALETENGVFFPRMKELLEQLTPKQAEFLVTVAEKMLEPIQTHIK